MFRNVLFEGFVIKKKSILNESFVVTVFSKSHGKIFLTARGVKKITSRRASYLETGNKINFIATKHTSGHWYLGSTTLVSALYKIKQDPLKSKVLYHALQILDLVLPEEQPEQKIYSILQSFLVAISKSEASEETNFLNFAHKIIYILGFGEHKIDNYSTLCEVIRNNIGEEIAFS